MNLENILRTTINNIEEASFSKTSLELLKQYPKTLQPVFLSGSDNEKLLAAQAYGKLLEKFAFFGKEIKNKQIIPSKEELNACESVVDTLYNSNKELLRDAPEIATAMKISEIQPVLSDIKTAIQQMKSENPSPNNPSKPNDDKTYLGVVALIIVIGVIAIGGVWIFKKRKSVR